MFSSTNEVRGTSYKSRIDDPRYQFAGKTGTAQVKRITERDRELDLKTSEIPYEERDHALYIAFGPYKNPRYAVSILIEHGGSGGSVAAPLAKKLFKKIIDRHEIRKNYESKKYLDKYKPLFKNSKNIKLIQSAMFSSTNEVRGTSYKSRIDDPKYQFAGKTGTAQVKRITERDRELDLKTFEIPYEERDHALYVAFGPYKNPRYATSIIIEHGGSGGTTAAPIAKKLFKLIVDRHKLRQSVKEKKYLDI